MSSAARSIHVVVIVQASCGMCIQHQRNNVCIKLDTGVDYTLRSYCGAVDKTTDSQPRGSRFETAGSGRSALGKALYRHCLVTRKGLKAAGPLVACL